MSQNYLSLRQTRCLPSHYIFGEYLFGLLKSENFEVTDICYTFLGSLLFQATEELRKHVVEQ